MTNSFDNFSFVFSNGESIDIEDKRDLRRTFEFLSEKSRMGWPLNIDNKKIWQQASKLLSQAKWDDDISSIFGVAKFKCRGIDRDSDWVKATAILTSEFLSLHWKNGSRALMNYHEDIVGVLTKGESLVMQYSHGYRLENKKYYDLADIDGEFAIELVKIISKSKHDNRRTFILLFNFEFIIRKKFKKFRFY